MVNQTLLKAFGGGPSIEGLLYQLADSRGGRWENIVEGDGEGGQRNVRNYNFNGQDYWALQREAQDLAAQQALPADILALGKMAGGEWGNVSPVNFGPGTDYLRDAQGRLLGTYQVEDGFGAGGARYLPWDILQKYPQLGGQLATQYQEASSNPFSDPIFALAAGAMAFGGLGGFEGLGGSEMFNAELLDASLIGEYAGAAPGSGSFFAPASQATAGMFGPGAAEALDASLIGPNAGAAAGSGSVFAPPLAIPPAAQGASTAKTVLDSVKQAGKELGTYAPLLGALAGGAAGAVGSGGKAGTITVEEGIPDWLMPYLKPTLDRYSTDIQNYNVDPYGVMPAAMEQFKNTISGQYLDPSTNKWLEDYYRLGAERVKGTLSPSFGHMQAFGSHSGYNEALSRGLSDMAVGLYGGAYEKERDRQNSMIAAAPNFLTQSSLSAFAPYQQYLSTVGGLGKKKDQPYYEPSNFQNILGGAMAGYGLGKVFA
jgi:hypothetical protein